MINLVNHRSFSVKHPCICSGVKNIPCIESYMVTKPPFVLLRYFTRFCSIQCFLDFVQAHPKSLSFQSFFLRAELKDKLFGRTAEKLLKSLDRSEWVTSINCVVIFGGDASKEIYIWGKSWHCNLLWSTTNLDVLLLRTGAWIFYVFTTGPR